MSQKCRKCGSQLKSTRKGHEQYCEKHSPVERPNPREFWILEYKSDFGDRNKMQFTIYETQGEASAQQAQMYPKFVNTTHVIEAWFLKDYQNELFRAGQDIVNLQIQVEDITEAYNTQVNGWEKRCDELIQQLRHSKTEYESHLNLLRKNNNILINELHKIAKTKTGDSDIYTMGCDCAEVALEALNKVKET